VFLNICHDFPSADYEKDSLIRSIAGCDLYDPTSTLSVPRIARRHQEHAHLDQPAVVLAPQHWKLGLRPSCGTCESPHLDNPAYVLADLESGVPIGADPPGDRPMAGDRRNDAALLPLFRKGGRFMERFMQSLSDQTKDTLVGIIDFGIAFCLVCLTFQVMQGFKWLLGSVN
jgi:hypothetical protein